jgi:hypothetical protein
LTVPIKTSRWNQGRSRRLPKPSTDPEVLALAAEGNGWVNWSGLATQLAKMETAFAGTVYRFFLTLRLDQPRQDAERSAGEVELRDP